MALIAIAADKGAPGVTTASVALAAVWSRPVVLAECDPSGGDLVYRLPAADGGRLSLQQGLLSLAVATRRGVQAQQVWEHAQKLYGGLDVLVGVSGAEQGAGLELLWSGVGRALAAVPQADVIADCGRVGVDGPIYDLLGYASSIVLLTRASLGEVVRLRDRIAVMTAALKKRGRTPGRINVVVVADYKAITSAVAEVDHALQQSGASARVVGGLAYEPKSAEQLRGEWGGKLDKSMFIRTARSIAGDLVSTLPELGTAGTASAGTAPPAGTVPAAGADPRVDRKTAAAPVASGTGPQAMPGWDRQSSPPPGYQPRQPSYPAPGPASAPQGPQGPRTPAGRPYPAPAVRQYPTDPGQRSSGRAPGPQQPGQQQPGQQQPGTQRPGAERPGVQQPGVQQQQPPAGGPQPSPVVPPPWQSPPWQASSPSPRTGPQPPAGTRPAVTPSSAVPPGSHPGSSRGRHAGTPTQPPGTQGQEQSHGQEQPQAQPRSGSDDDQQQAERNPVREPEPGMPQGHSGGR
ncbi:MAG TPA: hypothetical protein VGH27_20665 [Streptosporangiaceae bacterium]|jgi:hypothetical protein